MLDPGEGWTLVDEQPGALDSLTRSYQSEHAQIVMTVFPVTTPPGVEALFQALSNFKGFETTPEPSLGMAAWVVPAGSELDNGTFAILVSASTDHLFSFRLETDGTGAIDPLPFLRDLAQRQIDAAGGSPQAAPRLARTQSRPSPR